MGYHVLDPTSLSDTPEYPCDRRSVTDAVGLATMAVAVYELEPGEQLSRSYHYHEQREEVFFVLTGTLHVETPDGTHTVPSGSIFVAEPDSPIRPFNAASAAGPVRVFAAGAPRSDPGRVYETE